MHYLDHNATTPLDERVLDAMLPYLKGNFGNPSSAHALGRAARTALDTARRQVADLVGAHPTQVIFTSGGTEANNMALKGVAAALRPGRIVVSAVEHASLRAPATALRAHGWDIATLPVDGQGRVQADALAAVEGAALVSVMWANNETGVLQDLPTLAEQARRIGALLHTDAVQAVGKVPVDFPASGVHLMSLSAHKLYGPKGIGALVLDRAVRIAPLLHGGGQEQGLRGGTENLAAIVGFGCAAELARAELEIRRQRLKNLVGYLGMRFAAELPDIRVFGEGAPRLPNTLFFALPGIEGQTLVQALDRKGIAASSGSACGSAHNEPSVVLKAMGIDPDLARCAVRVSLGKDNDSGDIDALVQALKEQAHALKNMAALAW